MRSLKIRILAFLILIVSGILASKLQPGIYRYAKEHPKSFWTQLVTIAGFPSKQRPRRSFEEQYGLDGTLKRGAWVLPWISIATALALATAAWPRKKELPETPQ